MEKEGIGMALPSKYSISKKLNSMDGLSAYENGGSGSGNFGHSGRPGKVGGSGSGQGSSKKREEDTKAVERIFDSMREEGVSPMSPRGDAARDTYKQIQQKATEVVKKGLGASKAPKLVQEEVSRFLKAIETTAGADSVSSYYKAAKGILDGWEKGNGGLSKPVSSQAKQEIKELKAELDSLYERYNIMSTPRGFRK